MNHLQNILPLSNFIGRLNLPTSQNNSACVFMLTAICFTPESNLANGTVNNLGKQTNILSKHNKHQHTEG